MKQLKILLKYIFNNEVYLCIFLTNPELSTLVLVMLVMGCPSIHYSHVIWLSTNEFGECLTIGSSCWGMCALCWLLTLELTDTWSSSGFLLLRAVVVAYFWFRFCSCFQFSVISQIFAEITNLYLSAEHDR